MENSRKIRVAVIFGGRSAEHEVSLQSAKNVMEALDKDKYEIIPIGIDKDGQWQGGKYANLLLNNSNLKAFEQPNPVALKKVDKTTELVSSANNESLGPVDVVFPVLHGTYGEDGTIQGLFKLMNVPFIGSDVLGSAIGMDKDVMKRLLKEAGIPVAKFMVGNYYDRDNLEIGEIVNELGLPFFVKPANMGSSVGVSKVNDISQFNDVTIEAFKYDHKIMIEEYIQGREVECSVLGNEHAIASLPGEIVPQGKHEFYDYEAKYLDEKGSVLKIPAELPEEITKQVQQLAVKTFQILCLQGLARVDFFVTNDNKIYVNEANTIPGFTKISMYPKLWEASGIGYTELVDRLVQLALDRHEQQKKLKTDFA